MRSERATFYSSSVTNSSPSPDKSHYFINSLETMSSISSVPPLAPSSLDPNLSCIHSYLLENNPVSFSIALTFHFESSHAPTHYPEFSYLEPVHREPRSLLVPVTPSE